MGKFLFANFLQNLSSEEIPLAVGLNDLFLRGGCTQEIKEAANGLTVSYISAAKKTLSNFVCRKSGLKIRLTPQKPFVCGDLADAFPDNMQKDMIRATVCKRLSDPNTCNSRCPMGYAFTLRGEEYRKCRSMAFLFDVTEENMPYLTEFISKTISSTK